MGVTTNPARRWSEHNFSKKGAKYTARRRPVTPVWVAKIKDGDRSKAQKAEYFLKKNVKASEKRRMILDHDMIIIEHSICGIDILNNYSFRGNCDIDIIVMSVENFE